MWYLCSESISIGSISIRYPTIKNKKKNMKEVRKSRREGELNFSDDWTGVITLLVQLLNNN